MKGVRKQFIENAEGWINAKFMSEEGNFLTCLSLEFGFFLSEFV